MNSVHNRLLFKAMARFTVNHHYRLASGLPWPALRVNSAHDARRGCDHARAAEKIFHVVVDAASGDHAMCNSLAAEEDVLVDGVAVRI